MRRDLLMPIVAITLAASAASAEAPATLSATDLTGAAFDLARERGHVVIIDFWATWCAPCRVEMPALDAYVRRHSADGLTMLAISVDAGASVKRLAAATSGYSFRVARLDDTRLPRAAIPTALPAVRVYDKDGVLRYDSATLKAPPLDQAALDRVVTPLLAGGATTR